MQFLRLSSRHVNSLLPFANIALIALVVFFFAPASNAQDTQLQLFYDEQYFTLHNPNDVALELSSMRLRFVGSGVSIVEIFPNDLFPLLADGGIAPGWCYVLQEDGTAPTLPMECRPNQTVVLSLNPNNLFWATDGQLTGFNIRDITSDQNVATCGSDGACNIEWPPYFPPCLVVTATAKTNLRQKPDARARVVDTLENNERIEACERDATGDWLKVEHPDTTAWVNISLTGIRLSQNSNTLREWIPPEPELITEFQNCGITCRRSGLVIDMQPVFDVSNKSITEASFENETAAISYDVLQNQWAGFVMHLDDFDASEFSHLCMQLSSDQPIGQVKLELKESDATESSAARAVFEYIYDLEETPKDFCVDLSGFVNHEWNLDLTNYSHINQIVIVVERPFYEANGEMVAVFPGIPQQATIFIDNIRFESGTND